MAVSNGKGYVTNWGDFTPTDDDYLAVIDLTTNTIVDTISTSYLPEEIVALGNKVYVATGIFGNGDKVDVINTEIDVLEGSITVGNSPNSLQLDDQGDLWVLSSENLIEVNTSNDEISKTISLNASITSPSKLNFDNEALYIYSGGSVYKMDETASILPTGSEIDGVNFYDMRVKDGKLYGLDAKDFASDGDLIIYDLNTNTEIEKITLNIIPGEVYFN
jgi:DNA-binding beta-propeller fold protein YncE